MTLSAHYEPVYHALWAGAHAPEAIRRSLSAGPATVITAQGPIRLAASPGATLYEAVGASLSSSWNSAPGDDADNIGARGP